MIFLIILIKLLEITYCFDHYIFYGAITPSENEGNYIKWNVYINCDECIKDGCTQQTTILNIKKEQDVKFKFNLVPATNKVIISKLNITITSLFPIAGQKRSNKWTLNNPNFDKLYRFQFGHFYQNDEQKGLYLRLKFNNFLEDKYLLKINNEIKMQYILRIFKKNNKKIELANKILKEDEWKGKTFFDVKLNNLLISNYLKCSKKYSIFIIVKEEPIVLCELCHMKKMTKLHIKTQKLHMIPNCKHFVHKKCANERIKNRTKRSTDSEEIEEELPQQFDYFRPPFIPPDYSQYIKQYSNNSSPKEEELIEQKNKGEPSISLSSNNLTNEKDKKCPVPFCENKLLKLKKNKNGKESIIFNKDVILGEKIVFECLIENPILQNGQNPEYIYFFELKKKNLSNKIKYLFIYNIQKNKYDNEEEVEIIENKAEDLPLSNNKSFRREERIEINNNNNISSSSSRSRRIEINNINNNNNNNNTTEQNNLNNNINKQKQQNEKVEQKNLKKINKNKEEEEELNIKEEETNEKINKIINENIKNKEEYFCNKEEDDEDIPSIYNDDEIEDYLIEKKNGLPDLEKCTPPSSPSFEFSKIHNQNPNEEINRKNIFVGESSNINNPIIENQQEDNWGNFFFRPQM